ncbi:hypothetical protein BpHYR1_052390 [Brachionus plicatilis]|uniref:Uncharacterized protein n=1 Tax=Brachionus plicatilis TaxID=10195 RepID=A0A3M7SWH3_BRAPC|nr:hypothetical protein BpHYR1_052390 [Brachionus plicatilis]
MKKYFKNDYLGHFSEKIKKKLSLRNAAGMKSYIKNLKLVLQNVSADTNLKALILKSKKMVKCSKTNKIAYEKKSYKNNIRKAFIFFCNKKRKSIGMEYILKPLSIPIVHLGDYFLTLK